MPAWISTRKVVEQMIKRRMIILLSGGALVALFLASVVGVTAVSAQETTPPTPPEGCVRREFFGGFGPRLGRGGFGGFGGGSWTMFDTAAEALGLTPEEFFAEMHDGKTLEEIAEVQGVELEDVQEAVNAARAEAQKEGIAQAVEEGTISQDQADWMLEGLEKGFFPAGRGFRGAGFGRKWGRVDTTEGE